MAMRYGPFEEKPAGSGISMSRLIAFLFALTFCPVLLLMARGGHDIGWPLCALGVAILLAVPLQALFKTLQSWFATPPGKALFKAMVEKGMTALGAVASGTTVSTATTVTGAAPPAAGVAAPTAAAQPDPDTGGAQ